LVFAILGLAVLPGWEDQRRFFAFSYWLWIRLPDWGGQNVGLPVNHLGCVELWSLGFVEFKYELFVWRAAIHGCSAVWPPCVMLLQGDGAKPKPFRQGVQSVVCGVFPKRFDIRVDTVSLEEFAFLPRWRLVWLFGKVCGSGFRGCNPGELYC